MNNDKAIDALDRLLKYALHEAKAEQDLFANDDYHLLEQALTPQSSADLGRVELLRKAAKICREASYIQTANELDVLIDEVERV